MSEVQGTIHLIGETEEFGNNGFTKRIIVIETQDQYPQKLPIDFVKDNTKLLDKFQEGQEVKISINFRGNEHNGKYYVNLQGWKIESISGQQSEVDKYESANEDLQIPDKKNDDGSPDNLPF